MKLATLMALAVLGCLARPKPVTYVLHNCKTVEQTRVIEPGQSVHEELTCSCSRRQEKIDANTGKLVVECE